jgi:hypothetical protein
MNLTNDRGILDVIESASDAQRMCFCGDYTTVEVKNDVVWLTCASRLKPAGNRLGRFLGALTPHVHEVIIDLRADAASASPAAA